MQQSPLQCRRLQAVPSQAIVLLYSYTFSRYHNIDRNILFLLFITGTLSLFAPYI